MITSNPRLQLLQGTRSWYSTRGVRCLRLMHLLVRPKGFDTVLFDHKHSVVFCYSYRLWLWIQFRCCLSSITVISSSRFKDRITNLHETSAAPIDLSDMIIIADAIDRVSLGWSSHSGYEVAVSLSLYIFRLIVKCKHASVCTTTNKRVGADRYSSCYGLLRCLYIIHFNHRKEVLRNQHSPRAHLRVCLPSLDQRRSDPRWATRIQTRSPHSIRSQPADRLCCSLMTKYWQLSEFLHPLDTHVRVCKVWEWFNWHTEFDWTVRCGGDEGFAVNTPCACHLQVQMSFILQEVGCDVQCFLYVDCRSLHVERHPSFHRTGKSLNRIRH